MQSRNTFNGGEVTDEMEVRSDLDIYPRVCRKLENWDLSQIGGIKRRRGMRYVTDALAGDSMLFPFVYSYAAEDSRRFLVEARGGNLRVLNSEGSVVASFSSGADGLPTFNFINGKLRAKCINALMILTSPNNPPMQLKYDNGFTLGLWEFKHMPWKNDHEDQDEAIGVSVRHTGEDYFYDVDGLADTPALGDSFRASYWTEQVEVQGYQASILADVTIAMAVSGSSLIPSLPASCAVGAKLAQKEQGPLEYWAKKNDYTPTDGFVDPSNYPNAWYKATDLDGNVVKATYNSLSGVAGTIANGIYAFSRSKWVYWQCIKAFTKPDGGSDNPADYPEYFVRGIAIGDAVPCRGKWSFIPSGVWYGAYEVRSNVDTRELDDTWISKGVSVSTPSRAANTVVSGDESKEERWLRLFITESAVFAQGTELVGGGSDTSKLEKGFPPDSCENRLLVEAYRKDIEMQWTEVGGVAQWKGLGEFDVEFSGKKAIRDYSFAAFSSLYGYPQICEKYNQRIVFAATQEQPQTIWFSRVDDLDNFLSGDTADAAITLTMETTSQNPICWLSFKRDALLVGTSEAEWAIDTRNSQGDLSKAMISSHGNRGSDGVTCIVSGNKVIYVQRGGKRVYEYGYDWEADGYVSRDLTVYATHLSEKHQGFRSATMLEVPETVAVFVMGDGQISLCAYNVHEQVKGWHRWVTDGVVRAACALPDGNNADKLFLVVERQGDARIEVVDGNSGYTDDGRDYVSTVESVPMWQFLEQRVQQDGNTQVAVRFGADLDLNAIHAEIMGRDDGGYARLNTREPVLRKGWHTKFCVLGGYDYERIFGFRVSGDAGCHITAIQA